MTLEGGAVVSVIFCCLILLIVTQYSVDMILLAGLVVLLISGVISPDAALSGFSNEGMITVAALYVVAGGLKETGAIQFITQKVLGDTNTVRKAQARIMSPVMIMSAFLNNTPIVAAFIPALENWGKKTSIPVSKILIPLSYAAILGGACTIIGTSTNLILNGLLIEEGSTRSLGLFEPALIGVPCAIAGFIYLLIFGDKLLPSRGEAFESFKDPREYTIEMIIPVGSNIKGKTVLEAGLRQLPGLFLVEIYRDGEVIPAVGPDYKLKEEDRLIFAGIVDSIIDLQNTEGLQLATDHIFKIDGPRKDRILVEGVISNTHPLKGKSIKEGGFRNYYNAVVLAVSRNGERIKGKIGDIVLKTGDTLLIDANSGFVKKYRNENDFFLVSPVDGGERKAFEKAGLSFAILGAMVLLAGFGILSMLKAALLASVLVVITGVVPYSHGLKHIDWRVLVTIAATLGIGSGLKETGVADLFANGLLQFGQENPIMALMITYLVTWLLTEMITNSAAAVFVFPIALSLALSLGVSFLPFIIVIIMAASASFSTPIGYQTNLMVYGPGSYRYTDFLKIGLPLNLIVATITILLVPKIWPF